MDKLRKAQSSSAGLKTNKLRFEGASLIINKTKFIRPLRKITFEWNQAYTSPRCPIQRQCLFMRTQNTNNS
ncbi:hypothetical protein VNO77_04707 [Canavalia gladiata]|uniref:Uncharacterized protein n=1 Tax=Canavalia gladiata TaxID=3824 RepID=A0AAN9MWZ2_CANGL